MNCLNKVIKFTPLTIRHYAWALFSAVCCGTLRAGVVLEWGAVEFQVSGADLQKCGPA